MTTSGVRVRDLFGHEPRVISERRLIGQNLRAARGSNTQEHVAQLMRMMTGAKWTRATVAAVETGRRELSRAEMAALATSLFRTLGELQDNHGQDVAFDLGGVVWILEAASYEELIGGKHSKQEAAMGPGVTEAEQQAAIRLRIRADQLFGWARDLWGRSLTEERDRRLAVHPGKGSSAVRAGHITRQMQKELVAYVKERKRRGRKK
jgi:hypothetical protein